MTFDPAPDQDRPAELAARIVGTARGMEMFIRLGDCLEPTDGLWELVPALVAAEGARDHRLPAEVADQSVAGQRLDSDHRAQIRSFADQFMNTMDAAWQEQVPSESSFADLDEAEVRADPFAALASLVDFRALSAAILPNIGAMAGLDVSVDGMSYLRCYVKAWRSRRGCRC